METARTKYDKETDEEGKKRGVSIERSKAGTKDRSPPGLSLHNEITKLINITSIILQDMETVQRSSINKKQNYLNNRKITHHPPSPEPHFIYQKYN